MTKPSTQQNKHIRILGLDVHRILLSVMLLLGTLAISSEAFSATRTPISRDQASDNIALCEATGGFVVRTPSVVACCNENRDGSTTCVGCSHSGDDCANYSFRSGGGRSIGQFLKQSAPTTGGVLAPKATTRKAPKSKTNRLKNPLQIGPAKIKK